MSIDYDAMVTALLSESYSSATERADTAFIRACDGWLERPVVLHGAGNMGRKTAQSLQSNNLNLVAFSDKNPALVGTQIDGVPVYSPEQAAELLGEECICVVTVVSHGRERAYKSIAAQLRKAGFIRIIPFVVYAWQYPNALLPHYCFDRPEVTLQHKHLVLEAYKLFEDDTSKRVFTEQLSIRLGADFESVTDQSDLLQYFSPEVLERLPDNPVIIDGGAFNGDTLRDYLNCAKKVKLGSYYAFEPDPANYDGLCSYISSLPKELQEKITSIPKAIGDKCCSVSFLEEGGTSSSIKAKGEMVVECTTIDAVIPEQNCDLIKMDIEGFEKEALEGAKKVIIRSKPVLVISAYHKPNDFFTLMLFIKELNSDYKFFMDRYECDVWETVLYAV